MSNGPNLLVVFICGHRRLRLIIGGRICRAYRLPTTALRRFRSDRAGNGKTGEFPVAAIAEQVISEQYLRPKWCRPISAANPFAVTFWASLTNHSHQMCRDSLRTWESREVFVSLRLSFRPALPFLDWDRPRAQGNKVRLYSDLPPVFDGP